MDLDCIGQLDQSMWRYGRIFLITRYALDPLVSLSIFGSNKARDPSYLIWSKLLKNGYEVSLHWCLHFSVVKDFLAKLW